MSDQQMQLTMPEVGWLIELWDETPNDEHSAGWLCSARRDYQVLCWANIDSWAIRFARKQDAEIMAKVLLSAGVLKISEGHSLRALEHVWSNRPIEGEI